MRPLSILTGSLSHKIGWFPSCRLYRGRCVPAGIAQPESVQDLRTAQAITRDLAGRSAILDGEIVRPGPDGRPMFYELMRRRGPFCFYAFDLVWLDAHDLRGRPLLERK